MVYISSQNESSLDTPGEFPPIVVDKASPIPVYVQIAERIKLLMRNRVLQPGTVLPPERIVCRKCGVSRMTLRAAYGLLEQEGMVRCQRGHRTFIYPSHILKQLQEMRSFSEETTSRGATPSSKLLSFGLVKPDPEIKAFFGLPDDERIYEIRRLRFSDGMPIALEISYIQRSQCPNLERFDLVNHSLYKILEDHYGIQLHYCIDEISAARPSQIHRRELKITAPITLLIIKRKSCTANDTPVEYSISAYRGDCYSAIVRSVRIRN